MKAAERKTTALIVIGIILLPLQIWPAMPLPGMQVSDIVFAIAFVQFLAVRREVPPAKISIPIAAFAAGAAISAVVGGGFIKLLGHFELAAIGWMAASASAGGARSMRRALVIASAIAAASAVAGVAFYYAGFDTPLLNVYGQLVTDDYPRVRGTLVGANMTAFVVATGFLLLWFEPTLIPGIWARRLIFILGSIALLFTFSRVIVAIAIVLVGAELWRRDGPWWMRLAWVTASLATAAALWVSIRYQVMLNPLEPWAVAVLDTDGSRFAIWRGAAAVIRENPIFGIGPGKPVSGGWTAHNTWINLWALLGILPLAAFTFLSAASVVAATRFRMWGVACALIVALIVSLHMDIEDMRHVWLLFGIALSTGPGRFPAR
jgi:O-antigen ligase